MQDLAHKPKPSSGIGNTFKNGIDVFFKKNNVNQLLLSAEILLLEFYTYLIDYLNLIKKMK